MVTSCHDWLSKVECGVGRGGGRGLRGVLFNVASRWMIGAQAMALLEGNPAG